MFKMKRKPIRPTKKSFTRNESFYGTTVQDLVDKCKDLELKLSEVKLIVTYEDYVELELEFQVQETDEAYQMRLDAWVERCNEYGQWLIDNAKEIEEFERNEAERKRIKEEYKRRKKELADEYNRRIQGKK